MIVTNSQEDILVYLKVRDAFTPRIKKAVISGVPTTFSFFIRLDKMRSLWMDKTISDTVITHTVKYNNLKKEFTIRRSWRDDKPLSVKTFEEAQKLMTEINGFKIIPVNRLEKGEKYQIQAKAKMSKMTLPFYFHYILIMASMWEFETDWHMIDFVY